MPRLLADKASILRRIEENTSGCLVHVKEPGLLCLFAPSSDAYAKLEDQLCAAVGAFLVPNRVYKATVKAVKDFGAFVSLPRCDVEALLHISEVSQERIASIEDELAVGDVIDVVFLGEDSQGGLRVSKRRVTRPAKTNST
jgi:polyribonucleotide nucleotidyltransferase